MRRGSLGAALGVAAAAFVLGWMWGRSNGPPAPPDFAPPATRGPSAASPLSASVPPPEAVPVEGPASADTGSPFGVVAQGQAATGQGDAAGSGGADRERLRAALVRALGDTVDEAVVDRAAELVRARLDAAFPSAVAQAAEEERRRQELRRIEAAGEMAITLDALRKEPTPMDHLVGDRERFLRLMRHGFVGPRTGPEALRDLAGQDRGTRIELPPGRHSLPRTLRTPAPSGLTIAGAGIDRTELAGELTTSESLLGLTVEDLTIVDQDFLDLRGGLLTLTMRRVRAAGYNTGAGGSNLLDIRGGTGLAVQCEDCEFDGLVGRGGPKHTSVFSLSASAKLLRFDRCTFVGNDSPIRWWGTATVVFVGCTFKGNRRAVVREARYEDCRFEGNDDVRDGYDPAAVWTAEEQADRRAREQEDALRRAQDGGAGD